MDSESLDSCLQSTLAALYPPFEATATTVLCHVFDVVEKTYRGDGLRYLIDFLIPAKHILQCIQQDACFQYCGLLFRHEGWPLCIHEKIVVHLASIDWPSLKPGDFYLQVVPYLKKTPRIVLKCLAKDRHSVEELVIPEISYTSIFTPEWLDSINKEWTGTSLENCLLTTDEQLIRVPWEKVVNPEFIDRPKMIESPTAANNTDDETSSVRFPDSPFDLPRYHSFDLEDHTFREEEIPEIRLSIDRTTLQSSEAIVNCVNMSSLCNGDSNSGLEGEYVDIADVSLQRFGPQMGSLTQSIALNYKSHHRSRENRCREKQRLVVIRDSRTSFKNVVSSEMLSSDGPTEASRDGSSVPSENLQYLDCSESVGSNSFIEQMQTELKDSNYITHSEFVCQTAVLAGNVEYSSFTERVKSEEEVSADGEHSRCHYNQAGASPSVESQGVNLSETPMEREQEALLSEAQTCSESPEHSPEAVPGNIAHSLAMGGPEQSESDPRMRDCMGRDSPMMDALPLTATEHCQAQCRQPVEGSAASYKAPGDSGAGTVPLVHTIEELTLTEKGPLCTDGTSCLRSHKALPPDGKQHCCHHPAAEVGSAQGVSGEMPCEDMLSQATPSSVEESVKHLQHLVALQTAMGAENITVKTDAGRLPEALNLARQMESSLDSAASAGSTSIDLSTSNDQFIQKKDADARQLEVAGETCTHQTETPPDDRCVAVDTVSAVIPTLSPGAGLQSGLPQVGCMGAATGEPGHGAEPQQGNSTPAQSDAELVDTPAGAQFECSTRQAAPRGGELQSDHAEEETLCKLGIANVEDGTPALETRGQSETIVSSVDTTLLPCTAVERSVQGPTPEPAKDTNLSTEEAAAESSRSTGSRDAQSTADGISRNSLLQADRVLVREEPAAATRQESLPFSPARRRLQTPPTLAQDVNLEVLSSGVVCLPGTRDRSSRAVVLISTRNTVWLNPHCNTSELVRLFLYFYSIPRQECQALGLTMLVDARRCSPVPALFKAFNILQDAVPNCIHSVLLLGERDLTFRVEKPTAMQFELLTSVKTLHKHIESAQLPLEVDGVFPYCHRDWLNFRLRLEHLQQGCQGAYTFLQRAMEPLESATLPEKAVEASRLLAKYGQLMKNVLDDTRLVKLQLEGGAMLARLKKEESCVTLTDDYRDAVEAVATLYNQVDEGVHRLVMLSNKRIQELELVIEFEAFEDSFREVSCWIEHVGEKRLKEKPALEDSLEVLLHTQQDFRAFDQVACEYCRRGQEAMKKMERWEEISFADLLTCQVKLKVYKKQLGEFSRRLDEARSRIDSMVKLYQFFDKAYKWALEGMRHLACISMEDCNSPESSGAIIQCLEGYREQHPEISEDRFLEMKELACGLSSDGGAKQWKFAWSKCQETKRVFEKKLEAALRTRRACLSERPTGSGEKAAPHCAPALSQRRYSDGMEPRLHFERNNSVPYFHHKPIHSPAWRRDKCLSQSPSLHGEPGHAGQDFAFQTGASTSPFSSGTSLSSLASAARRLSLSSVSDEEPNPEVSRGEVVPPQPSCSSTPTSYRPFQKRTLRKAQSFDLPGCESARYGCQRTLSEPARRGNTGVFIKGLEVSSTEVADRMGTPRQQRVHDWSADCLPAMQRCSSSSPDTKNCGSKLRHIIDEMVTTEREYVRSLWYIIDSYFPEMERFDLPQDLRGKRSVLFGNLEKLYDFHSQYFLKELESCCNHPLRVSHCFLRHQDQFGMYALYSKNKPKSDSLLASHGNSFFKVKQMQLGDKMDLASYLLKPIQRMSKYALLLKDLIKECSTAQEQELCYLHAAEEMVKFQLRHGNDLLAMDAIRDCDVNLKEQGQLVRQDEFTIWLGRKKCQRHVFLFEDLILFSKPKRMEGGLDVYIYKRSFKTADIGLTENSGESGLRFEIWFRRRKSNDTYVLQAGTSETKQAWTSDVAHILWQQATRNKEVRMQEMVSMGVGNKPFMDIKPSDAAINDRAIDYIMKGRGARTRASIAVSLFDHSNPYKRTQMPISTSSTPSICAPSSASLLGPLNLHVYVNQGVMASSRPFSVSTCIEEDELEHDTSSQPSMTTESSESSQCMSGSGSSGSDSGCVSSVPQESLSEDACSPCDTAASYALLGSRQHSGIPSPPPGDKPRFVNRQYISANTGQITISPSTIV